MKVAIHHNPAAIILGDGIAAIETVSEGRFVPYPMGILPSRRSSSSSPRRFTVTPPGVGIVWQPARFLQPGQVLESWVEGTGTIRNRTIEGSR